MATKNIVQIGFSIQLSKEYPFKPPKVLCTTNFCFPSLSDGRDYIEDILEKPYISSITLDKLVNMLPGFIKKIMSKIEDFTFLNELGDYVCED